MPLHPAWFKNISRRVLWAALERDIRRADRLAMEAFFEKKCAYCESLLSTRWHADHLLPVDQGGFNHLSNRVPACPRCNEKEKREMSWENFLKLKCTDQETLRRRRQQIRKWVKSRRLKEPPVTDEQRKIWREEVEKLAKAIDDSWNRLRNNVD